MTLAVVLTESAVEIRLGNNSAALRTATPPSVEELELFAGTVLGLCRAARAKQTGRGMVDLPFPPKGPPRPFRPEDLPVTSVIKGATLQQVAGDVPPNQNAIVGAAPRDVVSDPEVRRRLNLPPLPAES